MSLIWFSESFISSKNSATCLKILKELSKIIPVSFLILIFLLSFVYWGYNSSNLSSVLPIESKNEITFSSKILNKTSSKISFFVLLIIFQNCDLFPLIRFKLFFILVTFISITLSIMILNNWELLIINSFFSNIFWNKNFLKSSLVIFKYSSRKIDPNILYKLNFLFSLFWWFSNFFNKNSQNISKFLINRLSSFSFIYLVSSLKYFIIFFIFSIFNNFKFWKASNNFKISFKETASLDLKLNSLFNDKALCKISL